MENEEGKVFTKPVSSGRAKHFNRNSSSIIVFRSKHVIKFTLFTLT
jgi:hypothetical protein